MSSTPSNTVPRHDYRLGEVFEYVYEGSEATYATEPAHGGAVPRVTELQRIEQVRTTVRYEIVAVDGVLMKQIEIVNPQFREFAAEELTADGGPGPFRPLSDKMPGFPTTTRYTFAIGEDGQVATRLTEVFPGFFDMILYKYVDIFSIPPAAALVARDLVPGGGSNDPGVDVSLAGATFHNHNRVILYDRIDLIDGVRHAYVKLLNPGNYFSSFGVETNYQQTFHVPIEGPDAGIVSNGELQEIIFLPGGEAGTVRATVRQVSMSRQTDKNRTAVG